MIQRIQSLYLLVALILTASLFFGNLAELFTSTNYFVLKFNGVINQETNEMVLPSVALIVLIVASIVAIVSSIILFKNRILQIRICGLVIGLLLGTSVMIFYFGKTAANQLGAELAFKWPLVTPLISIILVYLAIRAIGKDEALVRSLDRIR